MRLYPSFGANWPWHGLRPSSSFLFFLAARLFLRFGRLLPMLPRFGNSHLHRRYAQCGFIRPLEPTGSDMDCALAAPFFAPVSQIISFHERHYHRTGGEGGHTSPAHIDSLGRLRPRLSPWRGFVHIAPPVTTLPILCALKWRRPEISSPWLSQALTAEIYVSSFPAVFNSRRKIGSLFDVLRPLKCISVVFRQFPTVVLYVERKLILVVKIRRGIDGKLGHFSKFCDLWNV